MNGVTSYIDGAIVMYGAIALYTQRGWVPYLWEKLQGWKPSISLPAILTRNDAPPSLQVAADYALALEAYFKKYECSEGAEHALKCGELLSHAMFCRKGNHAPKT